MAVMEGVVAEVNEGKRRAENLEKLNEIANKVKFDEVCARVQIGWSISGAHLSRLLLCDDSHSSW